jgi:hypothetical protein
MDINFAPVSARVPRGPQQTSVAGYSSRWTRVDEIKGEFNQQLANNYTRNF